MKNILEDTILEDTVAKENISEEDTVKESVSEEDKMLYYNEKTDLFETVDKSEIAEEQPFVGKIMFKKKPKTINLHGINFY